MKTVKDLIPLYKKINKLIHNKEWEDIDVEIKKAIESDCIQIKLGLLRLTFSYKHNLHSWNYLYDSEKYILISQGYDTKITLMGLK